MEVPPPLLAQWKGVVQDLFAGVGPGPAMLSYQLFKFGSTLTMYIIKVISYSATVRTIYIAIYIYIYRDRFAFQRLEAPLTYHLPQQVVGVSMPNCCLWW